MKIIASILRSLLLLYGQNYTRLPYGYDDCSTSGIWRRLHREDRLYGAMKANIFGKMLGKEYLEI